MQMHTLPVNGMGGLPRSQSAGLRQLNRRKVPQPPLFPLQLASAGLMVSLEAKRGWGSPKACDYAELMRAFGCGTNQRLSPNEGGTNGE